MEQLEQLAGIRDAAEKRLEEARAAIERSPDAKLVASLTLLINDLRKSFEAEGAMTAAEPAAETPVEEAPQAEIPTEEIPVEESPIEESPVETNSEVQRGSEAEAEAAPAAEEFSLEDSLEAELLSVDDGSSKS